MSIEGRRAKIVLCIFSGILIVIADQFLKWFISSHFSPGQSIPLIKGILYLTFVKNRGAAFGFFRNLPIFFIVISITAIWIILSILYTSLKRDSFFCNFMQNFSLVLIMSGALGNLIDRLRFGYVIDFIDVRIWPVFNIADSAITIGTLILVFSFLYKA